jgi:hypothetical protein
LHLQKYLSRIAIGVGKQIFRGLVCDRPSNHPYCATIKTSAAVSLSSGNMEDAIAPPLALQMAIASLRLELSPAPTLQNLCLTDYA